MGAPRSRGALCHRHGLRRAGPPSRIAHHERSRPPIRLPDHVLPLIRVDELHLVPHPRQLLPRPLGSPHRLHRQPHLGLRPRRPRPLHPPPHHRAPRGTDREYLSRSNQPIS